MVEILNMLLLAVVQGLTEFLPVSSSGHLVLFQHFLGVREGDIFFNVILHVGTLGSILVVYRREILRLLKFDRAATGYLVSLAVGTLPAVVVGLLFRSRIEDLFHSPVFVAGGLVFTAGILFSTRYSSSSDSLGDPWEPRAPALPRAQMIGVAQAFAILPGSLQRKRRSYLESTINGWSNREKARWAAWKGGSGLYITSLNPHSPGIYSGTRYGKVSRNCDVGEGGKVDR